MESDRLLVLYPQKRGPEKERSRMDEVLRAALDGIDAEIVEDMEILEQDPFKYRGRRRIAPSGPSRLKPQDLQDPGDLAESKGAPGRPDQDPGDQPAKRHSRGLLGMSIPDVPALW